MKLVKTSVFRLSLAGAVFFTLLSAASLFYVYFVNFSSIENQAKTELFDELKDMQFQFNQRGMDALVNLVSLRDHFGHYLLHYYTLIGEDGQFRVGSQFLAESSRTPAYEKDGVVYFDIHKYVTDDGKVVNLRVAELPLPGKMRLIAALAQDSLIKLRNDTLKALVAAVGVTMILAVITGIYLGGSVLRRIQKIDRGLQAAINTDFKEFLPVSHKEDEFQALTIKLNFTLGRVAELIQGMREVTDNIAHDLRSPLTRMRTRIEVALLKTRDIAEYHQALAQTAEDCDAVLNTFNTLLSIAQAESGLSRENLETIDLVQVTDELADLYAVVTEEAGLQFVWSRPGATVRIRCRRQLLAQAMSNLLENATKYTPQGGTITLEVKQNGRYASFIIRDTGPGIPEKDRKRVLERFQRLDSARSEPGNGLGLSMVNAVAKLCQAELIMDDNNPGLVVELRFLTC